MNVLEYNICLYKQLTLGPEQSKSGSLRLDDAESRVKASSAELSRSFSWGNIDIFSLIPSPSNIRVAI